MEDEMSERISASEEMKPCMEAILKASQEMPSLRKGERNDHGGFNYVSIDDYMEHVARVVVANGLSWKIREVAYSQDPGFMKHGSITATYEVDLMHAPSGVLWNNFFRATIAHPLAGATTAGSSLSYLDKLFLRTTFHIVTGEADADSQDNTQVAIQSDDPFAPAPVQIVTPPPKPVAQAPVLMAADEISKLTELVIGFLPLADTEAKLTAYWNENSQALDKLKLADKPVYDSLVQSFKSRKLEIKKAAVK